MLDKIYLFIYLFIYIFFAVLSSQRRKTFLFFSNSLAAVMSAEKRVPKLNHSLLAVGDLSTGLVFSHYLKTLSVNVHYCSTKISSLPRNVFIDTRKTEF